MNVVAQRSVVFGAGFWLGGTVASAIDIYFFDHFELKWGRGWSLQVTAYLLAALAVLAAILYAVGQTWRALRFSKGMHFSRPAVLVAALLFGAIFILLERVLALVVDRESLVNPVVAWAYVLVGALFLGSLTRSHLGAVIEA